MSKRNPIEISNYIDSHFRDYLLSSFNFGDAYLQRLFAEQLGKTKLFKGPYLSMNLPFKKGNTINSLIEKGVLCKSFVKLNNINFNRQLYLHQEEAIRKLAAGRNAVVTTGTGSGKTECFLYPILNEILRDYENGNQEPGIRAIFLYPMNALVNDQIDRLRKILTGCPQITFAFYTGDTEERVSRMVGDAASDSEIPENELISREEIRNNPPHLLFTNYSMLEYMLIRPTDNKLFLRENLNNWKFVVLDEAHTYHGALGIEISMLLRRLTALVDRKPRFILTSATLGEKSKSEEQIIDFAKNLTSSDYSKDDIIFSTREPFKGIARYCVKGEDYIQLKQCVQKNENIDFICELYESDGEGDNYSKLYDLLYYDKNVITLYELLKEGPVIFEDISERMNYLHKDELIALIDLINCSQKDGFRLFDLKYHSFVRPLSGAYISLGKEVNLSLTKVNTLNDKKAFELANCRYCNAPYIFGRIKKDIYSGLRYLVQNDEVDIYENYGNNEFKKLDYFLLNDISESEIDFDEYTVENYSLCPICGNIDESDNLNAKLCKCEEKRIQVYRVKSKEDNADFTNPVNNITECPCCKHRSNSGIVRSLNLGKDEGTAFIAQTLYEAIGKTDQKPVGFSKPRKLSLSKYNVAKVEDDADPVVKQFLCFSDSRQQASFFAIYFDAMHERFLRKRIIWEIIRKNEFKPIKFQVARTQIEKLIRDNKLFINEFDSSGLNSEKQSWITLLADLLKVDGSYDSEGVGLYYFDLDLDEVMDAIDDEDPIFDEFKITKEDLETIIQVVFGVFKTTPAINYSDSGLSFDEKLEYLEYRSFDNSIQLKLNKSKKGVKSFLAISGSNYISRYIQKTLQCDEGQANEFLSMLFNGIGCGDEEEINVFEENVKNCYQINVDKYVLKNYKTSKYYRCKKCGSLTPYNVHDKCPKDGCNGSLEEINPDEYLKNNYYRNQYMNSQIEDIVVEEHTAQLERDKAKQYQIGFRDKKINVLSSSTTFEMGIDIGGLDTVFMRNVPPSPANYVQRAGRAGRRSDSAAYVLTYCSNNSHDYTYFCSPEKMISGKINPPSFVVLNDKIILRHLIACCFGFFFKQEPVNFESMEKLVIQGGIEEFYKFLKAHPEELRIYIEEKVIPETQYHKYHNFGWVDLICDDEKIKHFIDSIQSDFNDFEEALHTAVNEKDFDSAALYKKQINNLKKKNVISTLSDNCVIPKYGFPVDVVDLKIYENGVLDNDYHLSRDLKYAISEYAPESEVIVNKNKYTSRYIGLPSKGREFTRHKFKKCSECQRINIYVTKAPETCKYCGNDLMKEVEESYLKPEFGFKTGDTKKSTRLKPKRTYSGEVSYIGEGIPDNQELKIGNEDIIVQTSSNDKLLVMNRSKFYMCPDCGYSVVAKSVNMGVTRTEKHHSFKKKKCENNQLELIRLGHDFQTDVARITIPDLNRFDDGYSIALSVLYALLEGICEALEIDRNDIDGIVEPNFESSSYDLLVYDNVPGGAGHVKRLLDLDSILNSISRAHAKVSQNCCSEDTSCYNCLRNYYNQMYHSRIRRGYAKNFLDKLIKNINAWLDENDLSQKKMVV